MTGELDSTGALAQLANARYAPESVGTGRGSRQARQSAETLAVLTSLAEVRAAVSEIAATAQRLISIYTPISSRTSTIRVPSSMSSSTSC